MRVLEKECGVQWLKEKLHLDGLFFLGGIKGKDQGTVCVTKGKKKKKAACGRTGKLLTMDMEKAEVLSEFYASVFTGNLFSYAS